MAFTGIFEKTGKIVEIGHFSSIVEDTDLIFAGKFFSRSISPSRKV